MRARSLKNSPDQVVELYLGMTALYKWCFRAFTEKKKVLSRLIDIMVDKLQFTIFQKLPSQYFSRNYSLLEKLYYGITRERHQHFSKNSSRM